MHGLSAWAEMELASGEANAVAPVPPVEQQETGSCGLAALRAVMLTFGVDVAEDDLKPLVGWSPEQGSSWEGLAAAAEAFGFDVDAKASSRLADLVHMVGEHGLPVLVGWFSKDEGHFSVVKAIDEQKVTLMDVEFGGDRELPLDEFERVWFDFDGETAEHEGLVDRGMMVLTPKGAVR